MREIQSSQLNFGAVDISKIEFNKRSRDEMPQLLRGLQYIYMTPEYRDPIFKLLEERIAPRVSKQNGRPGMELWKILVMGTVRLNLNWNYDRLEDEVNHHSQLREMLGHGRYEIPEHVYALQTLKDNVSLLTEDLLDEINAIVVGAGHSLVKKKESEGLKTRMDSFVLESNVHYPTDLNLLFDAMRKVWTLAARACQWRKIKDLRQHAYQIQRLKNQMRGIQTQKHSRSKDTEVIVKKQAALMESHREYILLAGEHLVKIDQVMTERGINKTEEFAMFYKDALHQIDLIDRRVLKGEVIPHSEKIFSLFQRYTEWVSKGKAGVPVELGLKVCIVEDQFQFILSHRVMQQETDCEIAAPLIKKTKGIYPDLKQVSGDKGFHSPANQKELDEILDVVVIPKKGKCSKARQEVESSSAFKKVQHQHSAVESAINALEVHGLDVCPDKGLDGLKRYVSLAIVARNLQRMGAILQEKERRAERRKTQRNLNKALQMKAA